MPKWVWPQWAHIENILRSHLHTTSKLAPNLTKHERSYMQKQPTLDRNSCWVREWLYCFPKSCKYLDVWLVGVAAVVILSTLCCHVIARKSRGHGKRGWSKICNDQCCPMVRILPKAGLGIWCRGKWRDRDLETLISSEALRMSHAPLQESCRTSRGT